MWNRTIARSAFFILAAAGCGVLQASVIIGTDFATVNNGGFGSNGPGFLSVIAENQGGGYVDNALMTFDLSGSGPVISDGVLTLTVQSIWGGSVLDGLFELVPLAAPYDPNSVVFIPPFGAALDTESFHVDDSSGGAAGTQVSFAVPEATLVSWQSSPAGNFGVGIREIDFTSSVGHSDITFQSGPNAPSLTFTATPEPASWALLLSGVGLLAAARRRRNHDSVK